MHEDGPFRDYTNAPKTLLYAMMSWSDTKEGKEWPYVFIKPMFNAPILVHQVTLFN